jgi:hypothetical protein
MLAHLAVVFKQVDQWVNESIGHFQKMVYLPLLNFCLLKTPCNPSRQHYRVFNDSEKLFFLKVQLDCLVLMLLASQTLAC